MFLKWSPANILNSEFYQEAVNCKAKMPSLMDVSVITIEALSLEIKKQQLKYLVPWADRIVLTLVLKKNTLKFHIFPSTVIQGLLENN